MMLLINKNFKKILQGILLGLFVIGILEVYGNRITKYLSNTYQKEVCTNTFCVGKPVGWLPYIVKKNGDTYIFNLIPSSLMPWETGKETFLKEFDEGIEYIKDNHMITVMMIKKEKEKFKKFKKHIILSQECYEKERDYFTMVYCIDSNIAIMQEKFKENIIEEILLKYRLKQ